MRALAAMAVLAAVALAGCGGGNTGTGPAGEPTASAPEATAPPADATQPGTTSVKTPAATPTQTTPAPETRRGVREKQGGGEEAVRVPASFVVTAGRLTPPTITVPPFLAVELSVQSNDGRPHRLVVETAPPHALEVVSGKRAVLRIRGLRAGRYPVTLDGQRAGTLVAGGEVGP